MTRRYGDALADVVTVMLEVHEQVCEIEPAHRWERCTSTPSVHAVADALDAAADGSAAEVAEAMHDRECDLPNCWAGTTPPAVHARESWGEQAEAVLRWVAAQAEAELPPVASIRGDLMRFCLCGHIRRGHSVDGARCFASPCTCGVEGGFRPATK